MFEAELQALKAKRAAEERAARAAYRARMARKPLVDTRGPRAEEVAARAARAAFLAARRALEADYATGALVTRYA
jgi:hypothetical protein